MRTTRLTLVTLAVVSLGLSACGGSDDSSDSNGSPDSNDGAAKIVVDPGVRVVSAEHAAATIADDPDDLVILDVRTQEEFDEGHIEGAMMIDFYRDDFADELAKLDRGVPYILYCRSGNRSSETRALMEELDFRSVEDIDGGVLSWTAAELPLVTE